MKLWRILILCVILISVARVGNAYYELSKPTGYVSDTGAMLSDGVRAQLETDLTAFDKTTSNQIAVVTIPSLQNDTIDNFAAQLFQAWGIGQKGKDNGVLVLISKEDKQVRIEVGYGLEGSLTDAQSYWIIQNQILPSFRQGNYDQGVIDAVDSIKKAISGSEQIPSQQPTTASQRVSINSHLFYLVFVIVIWLASVMARSKSWWLGGVVGAILGIIFAVFLVKILVGWLLVPVFGLMGLAFDYNVSKSYQQSKKHGRNIPWWWGGGFGGGGFGGGSGGGFGGFGGGGSGGGGSSGGW